MNGCKLLGHPVFCFCYIPLVFNLVHPTCIYIAFLTYSVFNHFNFNIGICNILCLYCNYLDCFYSTLRYDHYALYKYFLIIFYYYYLITSPANMKQTTRWICPVNYFMCMIKKPCGVLGYQWNRSTINQSINHRTGFYFSLPKLTFFFKDSYNV